MLLGKISRAMVACGVSCPGSWGSYLAKTSERAVYAFCCRASPGTAFDADGMIFTESPEYHSFSRYRIRVFCVDIASVLRLKEDESGIAAHKDDVNPGQLSLPFSMRTRTLTAIYA